MATKKLQIIGGSILQSDWEETDSTAASFIKNKPQLPEAALSGSYEDLKDKPVIDVEIKEGSANAVSGGVIYEELAKKANVEDLAGVATSGSYEDLNNKPNIGTEEVAGLTKLYSCSGENIDGTMTQKAITEAIADAQEKVKMNNIIMLYAAWAGDGPYTQVITINDITPNSKIDMQADASTISAIVAGEFSVTLKNDNGTVTAYAVGKKPAIDLTLQIIVTEVVRTTENDVVWGSPLVGTGMAGSFIASTTAPNDVHYLWIDTASNNLLKYYNGKSWAPISAAWG